MRVHFVTVAERSGKYFNMMKLLLYSFRKNAGFYKNASFTVVFNGCCPSDDVLRDLKDKFDPLHILTMPRLSEKLYMVKFNAYYAVDESVFDVFVFLDSDILILESLDDIFEDMQGKELFFKGRGILLSGGGVWGYENLLRRYTGLPEKEIESHRDKRFLLGWPLFNGGVQVMTKKALFTMREDAVCIAHDLHDRATQNSSAGIIQTRYHNFLFKKLVNERTEGILGRHMEKMVRWFARAQNMVLYQSRNSDQIGLAMALLKNNIPFEVLGARFNHCDLLEDGKIPAIFHYFQCNYDFDRNSLFNGAWVQEYINSSSPVKKALADMVKAYNREYCDAKLD